MLIEVLLFGKLSEITGQSIIKIICDNTENLIENLNNEFPELKNHKFQISVNHNIVRSKIDINEHDEIALLPPFSGG